MGIAALVVLVGVAAFLVARPGIPAALRDLDVIQVRVDGRPLSVVIARDQARGLMGVDDLGTLDGMLFVYDEEVDPAEHRFWMQGVRMPVDVAFFDGDGLLVSQVLMPLCPAPDQASRTCPLFTAGGPFRWALETPAGSRPFASGARLEGAP